MQGDLYNGPATAAQVYVIGETGILEELDLKGIEHLGGPEDAAKEVALKKGEYMEHDSDVSAGGRGSGHRHSIRVSHWGCCYNHWCQPPTNHGECMEHGLTICESFES